MNVLFVCTANGGRSVLAERLLRREAAGRHEARSAGSAPGSAAHPQVLEALREVGIDASDHVPRRLDDELIAWADVVVATCDDACPVVPGKRYLAWRLPDPKHEPLERIRELRDDVERRVRELVAELDRGGGLRAALSGRETAPVTPLVAFSAHTGARLAEVGFLLLLLAGVWLAASELLGLARLRTTVAGAAIAVAGVLLIVATHWGHFGAG